MDALFFNVLFACFFLFFFFFISSFDCQGHDSERLTSLEETTTSGYPRNFILQRKGKVVAQARKKNRKKTEKKTRKGGNTLITFSFFVFVCSEQR